MVNFIKEPFTLTLHRESLLFIIEETKVKKICIIMYKNVSKNKLNSYKL